MNTEVNLPSVVMMVELFIHNIIKDNESGDMKQLTSHLLTTNTEVNLPTGWIKCELLIHKS